MKKKTILFVALLGLVQCTQAQHEQWCTFWTTHDQGELNACEYFGVLPDGVCPWFSKSERCDPKDCKYMMSTKTCRFKRNTYIGCTKCGYIFAKKCPNDYNHLELPLDFKVSSSPGEDWMRTSGTYYQWTGCDSNQVSMYTYVTQPGGANAAKEVFSIKMDATNKKVVIEKEKYLSVCMRGTSEGACEARALYGRQGESEVLAEKVFVEGENPFQWSVDQKWNTKQSDCSAQEKSVNIYWDEGFDGRRVF